MSQKPNSPLQSEQLAQRRRPSILWNLNVPLFSWLVFYALITLRLTTISSFSASFYLCLSSLGLIVNLQSCLRILLALVGSSLELRFICCHLEFLIIGDSKIWKLAVDANCLHLGLNLDPPPKKTKTQKKGSRKQGQKGK